MEPQVPTAQPHARPPQGKRARVRQRLRSPQEVRQWRRRMAGYALIAISFVLVINALVGENGYLDTLRARREYADLNDALGRVRAENQQIRDETRRLREDPAALEEAARRELRMGKPGEALIVIKDAAPPKPTPPAR